MLLERFRYRSAAKDLIATVGKSAMKFSDKSNFSKFSIPWNTSLLNLESLLRPRSRVSKSERPRNAPPSMVDIMLPCKSISSKVFWDTNDACRIEAEKEKKVFSLLNFNIYILKDTTYEQHVGLHKTVKLLQLIFIHKHNQKEHYFIGNIWLLLSVHFFSNWILLLYLNTESVKSK
jgi:hypothetical protein